MTTTRPALEHLHHGRINDAVAVVGKLTTQPSVSWRRTFRQIVERAGFGVHPFLADDVIIAIAEPDEVIRADFAIRTAVDMTSEATAT